MSAMLGLMPPFDSDEMPVLLEIFPSPRLDSEWENISHALLDCNIEHSFGAQCRGDTAMNPTGLDMVIVFQIPRKKFLFVNGERFQAGLCGPKFEKFSIFIDYPMNDRSAVMGSGYCGREHKYRTEIRLTLCPPKCDADEFQKIERSKQAKKRRHQKWQEIVRWCFQPLKNRLKPVQHSESPNAKLTGAEPDSSAERPC